MYVCIAQDPTARSQPIPLGFSGQIFPRPSGWPHAQCEDLVVPATEMHQRLGVEGPEK